MAPLPQKATAPPPHSRKATVPMPNRATAPPPKVKIMPPPPASSVHHHHHHRHGAVHPAPVLIAQTQQTATTTPAASATTTQSKPEESHYEYEDDDPGQDEQERRNKIITGIKKRRRIVLRRRNYLLVALVFITLTCTGGVVYGQIRLSWHGYPPLYYASETTKSAYTSLVYMVIVAPIAFVILKFRITNMLIGIGYMFLLVLCIIYPTKAIINGGLSIYEDTEALIRQFLSTEVDPHQLHKFWSYYQKRGECCGTRDIDRVEDWPSLLNTTNIPWSCCTPESMKKIKEEAGQNADANCGKGFARTRNRGIHPYSSRFPRVFSGFFLSLTQHEIDELKNKYGKRIETNPESYQILQMDVIKRKVRKKSSFEAFLQNWKTFYMDGRCNLDYLLSRYKNGPINPYVVPDGLVNPTDCDNQEYRDNDVSYPGIWNLEEKVETVGIFNTGSSYNMTYKTGNVTRVQTIPYGVQNFTDKCKVSSGLAHFYASQEEGIPFMYGKSLQQLEWEDQKRYAIGNYCEYRFPKQRQNQTTIGRKLLLNLDYLTTLINELGEQSPPESDGIKAKLKGDNKPKDLKNRWILWKIPTFLNHSDLYPFKLSANLLRVYKPGPENYKSIKRDFDEEEIEGLKQMYYLSRGIAENYVLSGKIFPRPCGSIKDEFFDKKLARDINTRWLQWGPMVDWKNPLEGVGNYFLHYIRIMVWACMGVAAATIVMIIIIAVVFWQYYSRIKAEEYANLALPKEFEVLHMKRASLLDANEMALEQNPEELRPVYVTKTGQRSKKRKRRRGSSDSSSELFAVLDPDGQKKKKSTMVV